MPSYVIRRSPERAEYLVWSTVVDAPVSYVMDRTAARAWLVGHGEVDARYGDHEAAWRSAEERLSRADESGASELHGLFHDYGDDVFVWCEGVPDGVGEPEYAEDCPDLMVGRRLTRDELFDACRAEPDPNEVMREERERWVNADCKTCGDTGDVPSGVVDPRDGTPEFVPCEDCAAEEDEDA